LVWEYALAKLWQEWGIQPQGMVGEGVGELTAACLSGALSLEAALGLVAGVRPVERGDLQSPEIPWVSGVTKKWITEKEVIDPAYWNRLLSQATSFSEQVKILLLEREQVLLEVGPGHTLNNLLGSHPGKTEQQVLLASLGASDGQTPTDGILSTLGELWLAGVRVDWYGFYTHEKRRRLPLPTYPFERKRYWIEPALDASAGSGPRPVQALNTKKADIADWFYIPSWKRSLLPRGNARTAPSTWLIFADEAGPGRQLAAQLAQAGHKVTTVLSGKGFARQADGTYRLRPGQKQDYDALFGQLLEQGQAPRDILYAWSVTGGKFAGTKKDLVFSGLLSLAQSLGEHPPAEKIHLTILSDGLHEISEDDTLHIEKSTLFGAMKVIAQENTALVCRNVDLVWPGPAGSREKLVGRLYTELTARPRDAVVAYRGAHRWVQAYEPVRLEKPANSAWLQRNSSYLIVGSPDGIALALAKHLAGNFAAKVAFACKQSKSFTGDQTSEVVIEADAAEEGQLAAAFAQVEAAFGRLNGVIYVADDFGRPAFQSASEIGPVDYETQFRARRDELQALAQALAERELDFCMVTSSLSSILGGLGLAVYAAAYSYVDTFVRLQNRTSRTPWISANWDAWKMAGSPTSLLGNRMDALSIAPEEGTDAFERILASGEGGQIIISTMDLQARLGQWVAHATDAAQPQSEKALTLHPRPDLATPYVPPRNEVEQKIAAIWQALLGLETVGVHDNFFELGGHSLMAVQVISRVRDAFGMDLPLTNLFEQPTIAFLADYIAAVRWALQEQTAPQNEGRQEIEL
jgi:acyl transferase domain-containing protein/acyl carrier protein